MPQAVELDIAHARPCHRCDEPFMLVARMPHALTHADGSWTEGTRGVGLCAVCDRDDPDAQGLLAFFAVHEAVTHETMAVVTALVTEWADRAALHSLLRRRDIDHENGTYLRGGDLS